MPNVLSPRDLVFRPDNMDETVTHVCVGGGYFRFFMVGCVAEMWTTTTQIVHMNTAYHCISVAIKSLIVLYKVSKIGNNNRMAANIGFYKTIILYEICFF